MYDSLYVIVRMYVYIYIYYLELRHICSNQTLGFNGWMKNQTGLQLSKLGALDIDLCRILRGSNQKYGGKQ